MPITNGELEPGHDEVLAVLTSSWKTIREIRQALLSRYSNKLKISISDAHLHIRLTSLVKDSMAVKSVNPQRKVVYKLTGSSKSTEDTGTSDIFILGTAHRV